MSIELDLLKQAAADLAVEFVRPGMIVGLGAGSTATLAVRRLAEWFKAGRLPGILGIPCFRQTEQEALRLGLILTTLEEHPIIDLTIDGADEVDPELNLIKGGGGALLREKIVAQASRREIIIADKSKLSPALGTHWAVPVEVTPFGWGSQAAFLQSLHAQVNVRQATNGEPFLTDQGNLILDCNFGPMADPPGLASQIKSRAGIVEHGLFIGLASDLIVAGKDGCRHLNRRGKSQ